MAPARKEKMWPNSPATAAEDAAVSTIEAGSTPLSKPQSAQVGSSTEPDWSAELAGAKAAASTVLEALEDWRARVGKLQSQLAAAKAEQQ
jgi:hypothetical protein